MRIRVGTRESTLAVAQTQWVIDRLMEVGSDLTPQMVKIKTKGDIILNKSIDKIGGKGVFVKEIERALLDGEIDMAVHSLKDMPSQPPEGLAICRIPLREDNRDVMLFREGIGSFDELPQNAKIGTGSKRRSLQLLELRGDLIPVPIRGNIETRIRKMKEEGLDGIILAAAGLKRLGLEDKIGHYFEPDEMIPSPGQGALAIEIREDNELMRDLVNKICDRTSNLTSICERAFMKAIDGSCKIPMGAVCDIKGESLVIDGIYAANNDTVLIRKSLEQRIFEHSRDGEAKNELDELSGESYSSLERRAVDIGEELARIILECAKSIPENL